MLLPARLYRRKPNSHKGDFGHVFVLAGSLHYTGAACLSVRSAMRAGAGLVTLGIPKSLHPIFASKLIEGMTMPLPETRSQSVSDAALKQIKAFMQKADCLLLGPGLSREPATQRLIRGVVASAGDKPMVIDADGLNALVGHLDILKKAKRSVILTPHPGELARLLNLSVRHIQENRKKVAGEFASRYNKTVILKGHNTLVASPGKGVYVNKTGNPGMASAGSGDVLSGIIAAFLGQGLDAHEAAKCAVYIHGLAGDLAAKDKTQIGLIASDIIDKIPEAIKRSK